MSTVALRLSRLARLPSSGPGVLACSNEGQVGPVRDAGAAGRAFAFAIGGVEAIMDEFGKPHIGAWGGRGVFRNYAAGNERDLQSGLERASRARR